MTHWQVIVIFILTCCLLANSKGTAQPLHFEKLADITGREPTGECLVTDGYILAGFYSNHPGDTTARTRCFVLDMDTGEWEFKQQIHDSIVAKIFSIDLRELTILSRNLVLLHDFVYSPDKDRHHQYSVLDLSTGVASAVFRAESQSTNGTIALDNATVGWLSYHAADSLNILHSYSLLTNSFERDTLPKNSITRHELQLVQGADGVFTLTSSHDGHFFVYLTQDFAEFIDITPQEAAVVQKMEFAYPFRRMVISDSLSSVLGDLISVDGGSSWFRESPLTIMDHAFRDRLPQVVVDVVGNRLMIDPATKVVPGSVQSIHDGIHRLADTSLAIVLQLPLRSKIKAALQQSNADWWVVAESGVHRYHDGEWTSIPPPIKPLRTLRRIDVLGSDTITVHSGIGSPLIYNTRTGTLDQVDGWFDSYKVPNFTGTSCDCHNDIRVIGTPANIVAESDYGAIHLLDERGYKPYIRYRQGFGYPYTNASTFDDRVFLTDPRLEVPQGADSFDDLIPAAHTYDGAVRLPDDRTYYGVTDDVMTIQAVPGSDSTISVTIPGSRPTPLFGQFSWVARDTIYTLCRNYDVNRNPLRILTKTSISTSMITQRYAGQTSRMIRVKARKEGGWVALSLEGYDQDESYSVLVFGPTGDTIRKISLANTNLPDSPLDFLLDEESNQLYVLSGTGLYHTEPIATSVDRSINDDVMSHEATLYQWVDLLGVVRGRSSDAHSPPPSLQSGLYVVVGVTDHGARLIRKVHHTQ